MVSGSNIFVNKVERENAKSTSRTPNILARALMNIVFKEEALNMCTLKGQKPNGKGANSEARAGLFYPGVETILRE